MLIRDQDRSVLNSPLAKLRAGIDAVQSEPARSSSLTIPAAQPPLVDDPKGIESQQREDSANEGTECPVTSNRATKAAIYRANMAMKEKGAAQALYRAKIEARAAKEAEARAVEAKAIEDELLAIAVTDPMAAWGKAEAYEDAKLASAADSSRVRNRKRKFGAAQALRGIKPIAPDGRVKARSFTVSICGKFSRNDVGGDLIVEGTASGRTSVRNAQFCGSAWTCPDCAQHIGITRGTYVEKSIDALRAAGFRCVMNTTTVPHKLGEPCWMVFERLKTAQAKLDAHGSYRALRSNRGYVGRIRVIEVTHGDSGWHVHAHDIEVYVGKGKTTAAEDRAWAADLQTAVYQIWDKIILNLTGQRASETHGFTVVPVWSANDYVAKLPEQARQRDDENKLRKDAGQKEKQRWGVQAEVTKAHLKKAEKGGRTPWDILDGCYKGVAADVELFRDYAQGTWNRTQFETTKSLRDLLATFDIALGSDLEIIRDEPDYIFTDELNKDDGDQSHMTVERVLIDRPNQTAAHHSRPLWLEKARHDLELDLALTLADAIRAQGFNLELISEGRFVASMVNVNALQGADYDRDKAVIPAHYEPTTWRATFVGHDRLKPPREVKPAFRVDVVEDDLPF